MKAIPNWTFKCPCGAHLSIHADSAKQAETEALDHGWLVLLESEDPDHVPAIFACSKTCLADDARGNR